MVSRIIGNNYCLRCFDLGALWEKGVQIRNDTFNELPLSNINRQKIEQQETKIYQNVEELSPPSVFLFKTLGNIDPGKHPPETWNEPIVLHFSERLLRLQQLIEQYRIHFGVPAYGARQVFQS